LTDDERIEYLMQEKLRLEAEYLMQEKLRLEAELAKIVKELRMLVTKI